MMWYALGSLPKQVRNSITSQEWLDEINDWLGGWACGCWSGTHADGTPMVSFCHYHQGYYRGFHDGKKEVDVEIMAMNEPEEVG